MNDLVSIIVPVYNVRKYIAATIESVLAQTYTNWELLLIENNSTDGTKEFVAEYLKDNPDDRITFCVIDENIGAAEARNYGMDISKGRFVAYLDSDDLWMPDKLEKQVTFMLKNQAAFSFTGYEFADASGTGTGKVVKVPETICYKEALQNTTILTSTVMFDTQKLPKRELHMPKVKSEDTALWWRILRSGVLAYGLQENLVLYRRIGNSLSSNKIEALRRIWNLYRKEEKLSIPFSAYNFCFWAWRAVKRRV